MRKDLTHHVYLCTSCQDYVRSPCRPPPTYRLISVKPWHTIAANLFNIHGKEYLLIVDYFSKYHIIDHLPYSTSSDSIINKMKDTFSLIGTQSIIYTYNGPQLGAPLFA